MSKTQQSLKGRVNKEEHKKRIASLLKFVFIFRYVFQDEVNAFVVKRMGLTYSYRLLQYCLQSGYLREHPVHSYKRKKVYYLTKKGLGLLDSRLPTGNYRFRKSSINLMTVPHNSCVIQAYIALTRKIEGSHWISEWILRLNTKKRRVRLPDGLWVINNRLRIAIELEKSHKSLKEWKEVLQRLKRNVINNNCDGVLIITFDDLFKGIRQRIFNTQNDFSNQYVFLTTFPMISKERVTQNGSELNLAEMIKLLEE